TRFSGLLFGVAGLGAVLLAVSSKRIASLAEDWGLDVPAALTIAKRYTAGDVGGALQSLPAAIRDSAGDNLKAALEAGFSAAAL
ncbi:hypothetical protein NQU49_27180, partial [Escherichia coli]|uniref:hypothetical protein n=1 Tax=Escherichia coli TaxID=562 RepID=UPI002117C0A9